MEKNKTKRGKRKREIGLVISSKMNKTITVSIEKRVKHPMYGKIVRMKSKVYAHDEQNAASEGDKVEIIESRPLSKLKRWVLLKVIEKAEK